MPDDLSLTHTYVPFESKACCHCKLVKPASAFARNHAAKDGLRIRCRDCDREASRMWKGRKERKVSWRKENADRVNATQRAWCAAHPEKTKAYSRAYYLANYEKVCETVNRRRARLRGVATERIDIAILATRDHERCGICGKVVPAAERSIDHILPISHGGAHTYANVRLAHLRCNQSRGNRKPAQMRLIG